MLRQAVGQDGEKNQIVDAQDDFHDGESQEADPNLRVGEHFHGDGIRVTERGLGFSGGHWPIWTRRAKGGPGYQTALGIRPPLASDQPGFQNRFWNRLTRAV